MQGLKEVMRGQPAMPNRDFFPAAPTSCAKCAKLPESFGSEQPGAGSRSRSGFPVCGRCQSVRYCCVDCQRADWAAHKPDCKKRAAMRRQKLDSDLGIACFRGDEQDVTKWLAAGADCNCLNPITKASAMMGPAQRGHINIVRLLIQAGANAKYETSSGDSALQLASSKGHTGIVTLLVEEGGAIVDSPDSDGNTPLISAAFAGQPATVRELLRLGANPRHTASGGATALSCAQQHGHRECVEILQESMRRPAPLVA